MKKRKLYFGIDPDSDTHEKGSGMCIGEVDAMGNVSIIFGRIEIFDFVQYVRQYVGVPNQTDLHIIVECHGIIGGDGKLHSNTDVLHNAQKIFFGAKKRGGNGVSAVSKASVNVGRNAQLGFEFQKACIKYGFNYSPVLNNQRQQRKDASGGDIVADVSNFLQKETYYMPTKLTNDCVQNICKELGFAPNKKVTNDDERSAFGLILPHLIKLTN